MNENRWASFKEALLELASRDDELLSALASALAEAVDDDFSDDDLAQSRAVVERISASTEQLCQTDIGSVAVIDALLRIDIALKEKNAIDGLFATKFAPLATMRALHAEKERWSDAMELELAKRSPIFRTDDRTVVAVPVGFSSIDSLNLFSDRVLAEVLVRPTKRVILVLKGLEQQSIENPVWEALGSDLKSQKIRLEEKKGTEAADEK